MFISTLMTSKRIDLERAYARTLMPLARLWRQAADRALNGMDVSASAGWALVQVGRLGDQVRQTDLARELDVTGASLVRVLDQVVAAGLADRHPDPVDGRVSRVRLTERGRGLVSQIEARFTELRRDMLADISDEDLARAVAVAESLEAGFLRKRRP